MRKPMVRSRDSEAVPETRGAPVDRQRQILIRHYNWTAQNYAKWRIELLNCVWCQYYLTQHHFSLFSFKYRRDPPVRVSYCHNQQLIVINMPVTVISLTCGGNSQQCIMLYSDIDVESAQSLGISVFTSWQLWQCDWDTGFVFAKVSLAGLEVLSCLIDRMANHFKPYVTSGTVFSLYCYAAALY